MSVFAIVVSIIFAAFPLRSHLPEIGLLLWSVFTWSLQLWAFNQDLVDNYDLQYHRRSKFIPPEEPAQTAVKQKGSCPQQLVAA